MHVWKRLQLLATSTPTRRKAGSLKFIAAEFNAVGSSNAAIWPLAGRVHLSFTISSGLVDEQAPLHMMSSWNLA